MTKYKQQLHSDTLFPNRYTREGQKPISFTKAGALLRMLLLVLVVGMMDMQGRRNRRREPQQIATTLSCMDGWIYNRVYCGNSYFSSSPSYHHEVDTSKLFKQDYWNPELRPRDIEEGFYSIGGISDDYYFYFYLSNALMTPYTPEESMQIPQFPDNPNMVLQRNTVICTEEELAWEIENRSYKAVLEN